MSSAPGAGPSAASNPPLANMERLSLQDESIPLALREDVSLQVFLQSSPTLDAKPPLFTAHSAPPVLETDYDGIREGFTFGTCQSGSFVGTPAAEKGPFEYPDLTHSASSSRRPSVAQPALRRGSSSSSTVSTITSFSTATRRPSLAPLPSSSAQPSFSDSAQSRRRGSMFHFQTKPVSVPIPPSLLARRVSLPATEAIFGLPSSERRPHSRLSLSGAPPIPQSPPTLHSDGPGSPSSPCRRTSLRLRFPPSISSRRDSLSGFTSHLISSPQPVPSTTEQTVYDRTRQSTSTNSSRGSLLSHSSLSAEDVIKDDDESTDQDTSAEPDTPESSSETESMGLFTDPWQRIGSVSATKVDLQAIALDGVGARS